MWLCGGHSGIDCRFAAEITRAAAGIEVSDGIAIIKKILDKCDNFMEEPKKVPAPLNKMYDLKTLRYTKKSLAQYKKFTKIFRAMGLDYPTWD